MLYLLLFIPPLILGALGQMWVKRAFADGSKVHAASGMTGAQVARRMLESGGLDVGIESIGGSLSDHYDPRAKVMRLSQPVGNSDTIAAVAVAAHETGHAFQDARRESHVPDARIARPGRRLRLAGVVPAGHDRRLHLRRQAPRPAR